MNTPVYISVIFFVDNMEARGFILIKHQANTKQRDGTRDDGNCEYNCLYFTLSERNHKSEH